MRQFILGGNVAGLTSGIVSDIPLMPDNIGKIGVGYYDGGIATFDTGENIKDKGFIVLMRAAEQGGPVFLPLYKNHFSYVKGEYSQAGTFSASIVIPEPSATDLDYTIVAVKKGVKFNERNKWTAQVRIKPNDTAEDIANKIVAYYMDGDIPRYGLYTSVDVDNDEVSILFDAETEGVDWELVPADDLIGTEVHVNQSGIPAYGDAKYIKDLADKAAADAGFEYTYRDPSTLLYSNYPLNPLKAQDSEDEGFTIFTLRFAEPREVKTVDEVVHQIVQVAFPMGSLGIDTFEAACEYLSNSNSSDSGDSGQTAPNL